MSCSQIMLLACDELTVYLHQKTPLQSRRPMSPVPSVSVPRGKQRRNKAWLQIILRDDPRAGVGP